MKLLFSSRRRVCWAAVVATALSLGLGLGLGWWMRLHSTNVGLNLLLIVVWIATLMGAAVLQGCLAGTLLWGASWRRRVLMGWQPSVDELVPEDIKDRSFQFYALLVLLIAFNYFFHGVCTGNFFGWYQHQGFSLVQLRSEDPEQRLEAMLDLADHDRPEVVEQLILRAADPEPGVRAEAMGIIGDRGLVDQRETLLRSLEEANDMVRGNAAEALGKLRGEGVESALTGLLSRHGTPELRRGALAGLGLLKSSAAAPVFYGYIADPQASAEVRATAAWAIGEAKPRGASDQLLSVLESDAPEIARCASLHAFAKLHDGSGKSLDPRYQELFSRERGRMGFECSRAFITPRSRRICFGLLNRPGGQNYRGRCIRYQLSSPETYRVKMLRAGARAAAKGSMPWLALVNNDTEEPNAIRNWAGELYLELKELK